MAILVVKTLMATFVKTAFIILAFACTSCGAQDSIKTSKKKPTPLELYVQEQDTNNLESVSIGSVSDGSLKHGKLVPFSGLNFRYFDTSSYLNNRAFLHGSVLKALLQSYRRLDTLYPNRQFVVMECSHKHGGKLSPHRTHQNGLSIDLMMPLAQHGALYYGLDSMGVNHYLLDFDHNGTYTSDTTIRIDFQLVAHHLLVLEQEARKHGLKIAKVIINTDLKDELYASSYGVQLKNSSIYVVRRLSPLINAVHDDHFHVDFELLK